MQFKFIKLVALISIIMALVKVYQHNLFVKITYDLQYMRHKKNELKKVKSNLLLEFSQQKNNADLYAWAINERGMRPCPLEYTVTLTF